ncbi:MAG: Gfo/Idh/MocA family oxidoreductase [Bacillota bacterium]|nr:Gfo/Idh/MocA family oxidoreductase [Bacillota bacterium]
MKKLKMALVGAGIIGQVHAVALHENMFVDFAAVVDIKKEAATELASLYGIPAYTSIEACLANEKIDAYDICVNEAYHVQPTISALQAKKHVLLEKPIAKTLKEAQIIKDAATQNGVRLMIAHLLHFDARYGMLLDAVSSGQLGDISSVYVKRCNTQATCRRIGRKVSFMYYLGVHDIEIMCACAAGRPRKVYAQFPNKICCDYGDDDGVFAIVNFDNGVVGCVEIDWSYQESMPMPVWSYARVSGTKGSGVVEADRQGLTMNTGNSFTYPDTMLAPTVNGAMHGAMVLQIDHFVQSVLNQTPFAVNLETPIDAVRIIEACFESRKTGLPVEVTLY